MARSKNPENYPSHYRDALLAVSRTGREMVIPSDNPHRLKQRMYAYINALDAREDLMQLAWEHREAPMMRQVSLTHGVAGVRLESKNHGTEADAFRNALAGFDPEVISHTPVRSDEEEAALIAAMEAPDDSPPEEHDEGIPDIRALFSPPSIEDKP